MTRDIRHPVSRFQREGVIGRPHPGLRRSRSLPRALIVPRRWREEEGVFPHAEGVRRGTLSTRRWREEEGVCPHAVGVKRRACVHTPMARGGGRCHTPLARGGGRCHTPLARGGGRCPTPMARRGGRVSTRRWREEEGVFHTPMARVGRRPKPARRCHKEWAHPWSGGGGNRR